MTTKTHLDAGRRHDFVLLYDVTGGNPNGDPDNGNAPRTDPETGHAWVTDMALKRKVRNFIADANPSTAGMAIHVSEGVALNQALREVSEDLDVKPEEGKKKRSGPEQAKVGAEMARRYFDVRAFGGVLSTGVNPAGQLRGPIQITCPITSVDPIQATELTITRVAVTSEEALAKNETGETGGKDREMGSKHTVPYALLRATGFFTPSLAAKTGFTDDDLATFWDALQRMWALDRSASRGMTGCRGIHIFSHSDKYGGCHPDKLFSRIDITRTREDHPARKFSDYTISVDLDGLDKMGIEYTVLGE
jgi:CRISPR-associated protein Csd2